MEIIVEVEEVQGEVIGVKARKLPPDYEPKTTHGRPCFREFVVEMEDYRPEDFNRDREWRKIKEEMKSKNGK